MDELISKSALIEQLNQAAPEYYNAYINESIVNTPAVVALPLTKKELDHLINDTIAYIWVMEDRGYDKPEYGYDSRKALLEKLKQFENDHFPELDCCG